MGKAAKALPLGATFTVTSGPCEGLVHAAKVAKLTVGRTGRSKFQIKDPSISEKHAELYLKDGAWYVKDVGSSYGTQLNGEEIGDEGVALNTGDMIQFGLESLVSVKVHNPEDKAAPSNTAAAQAAVQPKQAAAPPAELHPEPAAAAEPQPEPPAHKPEQAAAAAAEPMTLDSGSEADEPSPPFAQPLVMQMLSQLTPHEDCAHMTVEEYILHERDRLTGHVQAQVDAQCEKLRQDWANVRASLMALIPPQ